MARSADTLAPHDDGPEEQDGVEDDAQPSSRWLHAVVVIGVIAGVALRIWLLTSPRAGSVDSDEAIVGLVALHALRDGEFSAFFWGQAYGGTLEALLAVPFFAVFGVSALALKAVPITLSAVASLLVWRLGRRTVGAVPGLVAGVAMWMWPVNVVWFSTKERGFYWVCLVAGLAFLLVVLRLVEDPEPLRWWAVLGVLGGIGWWSSPQMLYFAVPGTIWLVAALREDAWRLAVAAPAAVVAAMPWLAYNLRNEWRSLEPTSHVYDEGIVGNIRVLLEEGVPVILGLWFVPGRPWTYPVLYLVVCALVVVGVARQRRGTGLLALATLTFPLIYAIFPVSGVVGEGRYVLFLLPLLALLIAHAAATTGRAAVGTFLAGALALSVWTAPEFARHTRPVAVDVAVPADIDPLLDALEERGITHIAADYWIAFRVVFETEREIIAAPIGTDRYPPYTEEVVASSAPAWVFADGTWLIEEFEREMVRRGIAYDRFEAGRYTVFQPETLVICWPVAPGGLPCSVDA